MHEGNKSVTQKTKTERASANFKKFLLVQSLLKK